MARNMLHTNKKTQSNPDATSKDLIDGYGPHTSAAIGGNGKPKGSGVTNVVTVDELPKLLNIYMVRRALSL